MDQSAFGRYDFTRFMFIFFYISFYFPIWSTENYEKEINYPFVIAGY